MARRILPIWQLGLALVLSGGLQGELRGQEAERVAPKLPPPPESVEEAPVRASDLPELVGEDIALLEKLHGIVLVPKSEDVVEAGISGVMGLSIRGVDVPKETSLQGKVARFMGAPFSTVDLQNLTREIVLHYRENGRPVVDVVVPAQDLTAGVLQLVVIEGRLGSVSARGNRWFSENTLVSKFRIEQGDLLRQNALLKDLDWVNENPFRQVDLVYTPGDEVGDTNLVLQTEDRFPVRVFSGIENTGTESTGEELLLAGFNWGNALWLDHIFSYQFSSTTDFESLRGHSVVYDMPLPWRHRLTLLGLQVETQTESILDEALDLGLNTEGESLQGSLLYEVPLPRIGPFKHSTSLGFDYKETNNNLEFGGVRVFDVTTQVLQWSVRYDAEMRDPWGETLLNGAFFYSPGDLTGNNTDEIFQQSRAFAESDYYYGTLRLSRLNKLPWDFSLYLSARGQLSSGNLLPSEQLALGGYGSVRGYEFFSARGDEGAVATAELRSPAFPIIGLFAEGFQDRGQIVGFIDYGYARNRDLLPDEPSDATLLGAGVGVRYQVSSNVSVRVDYGWQLEDLEFAAEDADDGRLDFSAVISF